ncbi:hypothetical protein BW723_07230 [Polaribacter reichenbachii]|uniref:DUF5689 domain-containing protein n=1 Tax=Polaribacter reichenbachii TaxID=996801 RepID=A0A1B8U6L5_9FLAO|nr:DUF5689 domain-containing protein [Polaribacter reichenbachii]APZ46100.1 hypothetical protein BW723_07230 [Polaribacter reichenbachii]AUC19962.1 hypothetical protein BTO17_15250 [Polaribacter reichenbachii]OBY67492.1 hypothetical protein LPB301_02260 [Polaribacter reichenbachii]
MKTNKIYGFLSLLIAFSVFSCVADSDFAVPNVIVVEPDITANSNLLAVQSALIQEYNSSENVVYTFYENEDNPTYVEAYVVSTDATGNFYKKLIVQDKPENPTAGLEIVLNKTSLSETYEVGRKIYIKLDGLSVSYDDGESIGSINPENGVPGKYVLGVLDGGQVYDIPSTEIENHIWRSATIVDIVPTAIQLQDITDAHINTMIQLTSSQFLKSDLTTTFAGESYDEYDGFRTIYECETEATIQLQTSTFASFKSNVVPQGKGIFKGVLSKDYTSEFLVAIINTPSDIDFTDDTRCDPLVLECSGTSGGETVLFSENFEGFNSYDSEGWDNINIDGTSTDWFLDSFNSTYSRISAFNSDESDANVWLVTPTINMDNTTGEELFFDIQASYFTGTNLSVFVSSNYSGDPTTATWLRLDAVIPTGPKNSFGTFNTVGPINISCLDGDINIGFFYEGSDPVATTRYHLDNVKILGN